MQKHPSPTSLKRDQNITIIKVNELPSDTNPNTYESLSEILPVVTKRRLRNICKNGKRTKPLTGHYINDCTPGEAIPCINELPMIHTEGALLRPITISIDLDIRNISKHLARILAPLVSNIQLKN